MRKATDDALAVADVIPLTGVPREVESSQTMASTLFDSIRSDIIRGQLAPGSKLKIQELAARYGAGTIPVREALSRLATSGFVDAKDQRGFSVRPVSAAELLDLHRTRLLLESVAIRDSIHHGDVAWESRVLAAHHRMARLYQFTGPEGQVLNTEWEAAHNEFHHAIVAACTSPWLLQFVGVLRDQTARYRHISGRAKPTASRDVAGEHKDILDAVLAHDADLTVERITAHLTRSTTIAMTDGLVGMQAATFKAPHSLVDMRHMQLPVPPPDNRRVGISLSSAPVASSLRGAGAPPSRSKKPTK